MFLACLATEKIKVLDSLSMQHVMEGKKTFKRPVILIQNLHDFDMIICPVLENRHWTLLVSHSNSAIQ